ncbi:MAG: PEGA domain-containing protein [Patescibacteria group bacterium]|nr:PEGA domain-containing protein [Patescibacteria group bacterium]
MKKRTRQILFFIFLSIFFILAPILVLHVQGYRLDFKNKKVTQTGGLFIKTIPKQAQIYLDGKLSKKTDFFFGSVLIENILPKKYKIEAKKEGYSVWEKALEIREKEVTEAKSIILFPKEINYTSLAEDVENIWFSPNKRKVILKEKEEGFWALKLYDLDKNLKSHVIRESDISKKGADLFGLKFSENGREILLETGTAEQLKYFTLDINRDVPILEETKRPLFKTVVAYQIFNGDSYYLDNLGDIYKVGGDIFSYENESLFPIKERVTTNPFPLKKETEYKLHVFPEFIFIQEERTLHLLSQDTKLFKNFFERVSFLKMSTDREKLAYFSEKEIRVLFLKEQKGQPRREKGESVFLLRLSEKIKDAFWVNSSYLILNTENNIKIIEIDNRDRINIVDLAKFQNPEILWNQKDKKLYVLDEGNLSVSEKLIR